MTTKAELTKKIAELQAQVDSMPDDKPKYPFELGEKCFYLWPDGGVFQSTWSNHEMDIKRYNMGNTFKAEAEAIKARDKQLALVRVNRRIDELNGGWVADWRDNRQAKCNVYYDHKDAEFGTTVHHYTETLRTIHHCKSDKIARQIIEEHEADILLIMGVER